MSDDGDVLIYAGIPVSAAVNNYAGGYQFVVASAIAAAATTFSETGIVDNPFGESDRSPVEGSIMPLRFRITQDSGKLSGEFKGLFTLSQAV
jgi:hypothetical protein